MLEDAALQSLPAFWERRAATMEWARPKRTDFHGSRASEELTAKDQELALIAEQCRVHAQFLRENPDAMAQALAELIPEVLAEEVQPSGLAA